MDLEEVEVDGSIVDCGFVIMLSMFCLCCTRSFMMSLLMVEDLEVLEDMGIDGSIVRYCSLCTCCRYSIHRVVGGERITNSYRRWIFTWLSSSMCSGLSSGFMCITSVKRCSLS